MPDYVIPTRLRFDKAEVIDEGEASCRVRITLSYAGRIIHAEAPLSEGPTGYLKAAAIATLTAVEETVDHRFTAHLADLDHVNALGKDLVAVLVNIVFESRDVQVFGSCQIAESELAAAGRAALNATNRFVDLSMRN